MLMQITYKTRYDEMDGSPGRVYIYDDEHMTENEAQYNLRAERYSPYGFSMQIEHFELLKKHLKNKYEQ